MTRKLICLLALFTALLKPLPARAEVTFYLSPEGDNGFVVEADDINEKASVEITVLYDPAILANPHLSLETGTVTDLFDTIPGTLVFKADQPEEPVPSFLAHLTFERPGNRPGGILSVKGKILEPDGTVSQSRTLPNLPVPPSSALASERVEDGESGGGAAEHAGEETERSAALLAVLEKSGLSVLQRFQEYRGERNLAAFLALFEKPFRDPVAQDPPLVLSDGRTQMRITVKLPEKGATPNVALQDAKLIEMRREGEGQWVITALPDQGTWNASLILQAGDQFQAYPLLVAPPVKVRGDLDQVSFLPELERFSAARESARNGASDPQAQSLDEYIFTANYLVESGTRLAK